MQNTGTFYNRISFLYPLINCFIANGKKLLAKEVNALPQGSLLEIGVGEGSHLALYEKHIITGIDISAAMLKKAQRYKKQDTQLLLMDGENLIFTNASFDYVVLSHVLAVSDNPERLLSEAGRVLKPGGRLLILNHFTPDNWLQYADRAFRPFSSLLHFRSVFRLEDIKGIEKFSLQKQVSVGRASYFKLYIVSKP